MIDRRTFVATAAAAAAATAVGGAGRLRAATAGGAASGAARGDLLLTDAIVLTMDGTRRAFRSGYVWLRGLYDEMPLRVVDAVQGDAEIRAPTFTGEGKAFCVGLNYELLQKAFDDIDYFESVVRRFNAILLADEAKIGDVHAQYGVMPGGGATQRLPRRVGEQRAKEIIYMANWLSGPEAVACGLALRSVPLAELPAAVESMLATLRHRPRALSAALKRCLHAARQLDGREGIEFENREFVRYMGEEPYGREGYRASLEGRDPSWYLAPAVRRGGNVPGTL